MGSIEEIEYSGIELPIGTRFYYKGKLCEVVELEHEYDYNKCSKCDMSFSSQDCKCRSPW